MLAAEEVIPVTGGGGASRVQTEKGKKRGPRIPTDSPLLFVVVVSGILKVQAR